MQGEQGMGKTALLDTFLGKVHYHGLTLLRARCVRMGRVVERFLPLLKTRVRSCGESYGRLIIDRQNHFAPTWLYQMLNVLDSVGCAMLQSKVLHINSGRMLREGAYFFETLSKV